MHTPGESYRISTQPLRGSGEHSRLCSHKQTVMVTRQEPRNRRVAGVMAATGPSHHPQRYVTGIKRSQHKAGLF